MKNKLLNAKEIDRWANRKMDNFNANLKTWSKSKPFMWGNPKVPKGFYSNNIYTLKKAIHDNYGDKAVRLHPQGNAVYLHWHDELGQKEQYSALSDMAKHNPEMMSFQRDLEMNTLTPKSMLHLGGYYNVHHDDVPSKLVQKDLRKVGNRRTENYGMFLEKHPKFARAIDVVPAQKLRDYNTAHGLEKRNRTLTNMSEYYDGQSIRKYRTNGHQYIDVDPSQVQLRGHRYLRHKQVQRGERIPNTIFQGDALDRKARKDSLFNYGRAMRNSPELAHQLGVVTGTELGDDFKVFDEHTHKHVQPRQLLERNRRYMVHECKHLLHSMDKADSHRVSNDVVKQAQAIAKHAGVNAVSNKKTRNEVQHSNDNQPSKAPLEKVGGAPKLHGIDKFIQKLHADGQRSQGIKSQLSRQKKHSTKKRYRGNAKVTKRMESHAKARSQSNHRVHGSSHNLE